MAAPAPRGHTPVNPSDVYRHGRTGSTIAAADARRVVDDFFFNRCPSAVLRPLVSIVASIKVRNVGEYAESVVDGRLKMQLRSAPSGTVIQSRPRRLVAPRRRRRHRDGTSLTLSALRVGPTAGPEIVEGCSRKWSGCPTSTGRSTAT